MIILFIFNNVALLHSMLANVSCLGAGGGALWRPWYDSVRHGSLCFHDEQASLLCFVCVLYGKLLPRGKMRQVSFFAAGSMVYNSRKN